MLPPPGKHRRHRIPEPRRTFYRYAFFAAACFNALYGLGMMLLPHLSLRITQFPVDQATPLAVMFWQGVGVFVFVYALGFWFVSRDPERYAAFILVALIGKFLGINGFLYAWLFEGVVPGRVGFNTILTDVIWLPAFLPFVYETCVQRRYEPR